VRRDRECLDAERLKALRRHVDEGLDGPVSELTNDEIFAKALKLARTRGGIRD
jgi:hypothetical protein